MIYIEFTPDPVFNFFASIFANFALYLVPLIAIGDLLRRKL